MGWGEVGDVSSDVEVLADAREERVSGKSRYRPPPPVNRDIFVALDRQLGQFCCGFEEFRWTERQLQFSQPEDAFPGRAHIRRGMQRILDERCQLMAGTHVGSGLRGVPSNPCRGEQVEPADVSRLKAARAEFCSALAAAFVRRSGTIFLTLAVVLGLPVLWLRSGVETVQAAVSLPDAMLMLLVYSLAGLVFGVLVWVVAPAFILAYLVTLWKLGKRR